MNTRKLFAPSQLKRGFTIVELMVVVSILALLISLLLPALGKARLAANNTLGATNITSIGKAAFVYSSDNNGFITIGAMGSCKPVVAYPLGNYTVGQSGVAYGYSSCTNWQWFCGSQMASLPNGPLPNEKYTSLGVLYGLNYISDPTMYYHPMMRSQTQTDTSGGARRHWWQTSISRNWMKDKGDPSITEGPPLSPQPTGSLGNGSLFINITIASRSGYWPTFGTRYGASPTFSAVTANDTAWKNANTYDNVKIQNARVDATGFNVRSQWMGTPWENQFRRQGGFLDYVTGDGSAHVTTNTQFATNGGTAYGTTGTNGPALTAVGGITSPNGNGLALLYVTGSTFGIDVTTAYGVEGPRGGYWFWLIDDENGILW